MKRLLRTSAVTLVAFLAIRCGNESKGITNASGGDQGLGGSNATSGAGGSATAGAVTGGAPAAGGTTATGSQITGGTVGFSGATSSGGKPITGGSQSVGGFSAGGVQAGGNSITSSPTGGTGGIAGTGGGTDSDSCDVGVYDPASPPRVLPLSGATNCHDPSAIAVDNTYYAFCTGLGAETSTNMTSWRGVSPPFGVPQWLSQQISNPEGLWAPDISQFGGKYHLYYAGSQFSTNRSCIGHATRSSLTSGAWTDDGAATICSNVDTSDDWNAIDPNLVLDTDGKPWLTFGSFWGGLKVIQLDSAGKRVGTTVTAIAARPNNGGALEAPFMVRRCGYYYLFMSWDTCCKGASSTYNMRVVRGTSITGPFVDQAGTPALQGGGALVAQSDSNFAGPGGQSVMFVGNKAYLVYHAYAKPSGATTLRIADLVWDTQGWPLPVGP